MKALLIDANALIHRLYHALPYLEDKQKRPVQVLYGLSNILLKLIPSEKPDYIFAAYDLPLPTLRHQIFKEYKATRQPTSEDLKIQISLSKKIFFGFNIPIIEKPGFEADDIIATLVKKMEKEEKIILTGDLDTLQLVDQKTKVLTMKKGISETILYDSQLVKEKFNILPRQIPDYKSLIGDQSDNIIGIKGIGPKTASSLLNTFHDIETLIKACKEGKVEAKISQAILENEEKLFFNKNLITLKTDIEIEEQILNPYRGYQKEHLLNIFQEFNFKSLINRLKNEDEKLSSFGNKNINFLSKQNDLFTTQEIEINSIKEIKPPFFFLLDNTKIKIIDQEKKNKTIDLIYLEEILKIPEPIFTYNLKNAFKELAKKSFYFDKERNILKNRQQSAMTSSIPQSIYDIKIIFWLLNPQKSNPSLESIILFENPQIDKFYLNYLVLETCFRLLEKLEKEDLLSLYLEIDLPLIPILARMELRGIKVNIQELNSFKEILKVQKGKILKEINNTVGFSFNPLSTKQLREVLFQQLKINTKHLSKTSKGEISTREKDLIKIKEAHPIIPLILNFRKINKFLNTYTENFLKNYLPETQKIHTIFEQTGTVTGRISSEKPNLQNIPLLSHLADHLRSVFIPENKFIFISADYSQIELRILAHLSNDDNLISSFWQKIDIHSQTAKLIFGSDSPENRKKAKIINFSIVYGSSARSIAEKLGISISEAQNLINKFFYFYPSVKKYQEEAINKAKIYGLSENLFGRKRFLPEINYQSYREKATAERLAVNFPIQSLASDLFKKAMIAIDNQIYTNFCGKAFMLLPIHDELIFEVSQEISEKFKVIIKEVMEKIYPLKVPLEVTIKEGKNLKDLEK